MQWRRKTLTGRFEAGEFSEEIAYSQLVLGELGYNIIRKDGFFDQDTAKVVASFRERHDLQEGRHIDEVFFTKLAEEIQRFKTEKEHDMPLQMAISYLMHQLEI